MMLHILLLVLVAVAVVACMISGLILWICPKHWVVHNAVAAKVYRRAGPPPWQVLNRLGKAATIGLYLGAGVAIALLVLGSLLEPGR